MQLFKSIEIVIFNCKDDLVYHQAHASNIEIFLMYLYWDYCCALNINTVQWNLLMLIFRIWGNASLCDVYSTKTFDSENQ